MKKYDNIPDEMKNLKRFVGWRKEEREDKLGNIKVAKIPYSLINGKSQDWNKEYRWLDYKTAMTKKEPLGFVLREDNIICIDLDNAISNVLLDKNKEINELIEKWTQKKPSTLRQIREYRYEPIDNFSRVNDLSVDEILATMERTNRKANRLISGASLTGDHSRDDFIFLVLASNYTDGNPSLMKELFFMTPLNRLGSYKKRRDDRKYIEYVDKTIESVLGLGNFVAFDWSRHFEYKKRMKAYERI